MNNDASYVSVTDYRDLLRSLNQVEPKLASVFRAKVREAVAPLRDGVKQNIPMSAPLGKPAKGGGMVTSIGRLSWGFEKRPNTVLIDTRAPRSNKGRLSGSIVKLRVTAPATVFADMAGRSGKYIGARRIAGATRRNTMVWITNDGRRIEGYRYTYHTKEGAIIGGRVHRNTGGQGRALIRSLGKRPSRYAWPGAIRNLPATRKKVINIFENPIASINREMRSR